MEQVFSINDLKQGDKIVKITEEGWKILEFVCKHPHNDKYSLFLNETYDGTPKFYNKWIEEEEWYHYCGSKQDWKEIFSLKIKQLQKDIIHYTKLIK